MDDSSLKVLVDVEGISVVVLLKNVVSFGNFLRCSIVFICLAYPSPKESFNFCLSCELKEKSFFL
jgi:hypothetical protein